MIEVKFIGTSSGFAESKRFHSQIYFKSSEYNLLIDAPDGCSKAILNSNENFNDISGIIITHFHPDHVSGLASLIQQMKLRNRRMPLEIFTHKKMKPALVKLLALNYIFIDKTDFNIKVIDFVEGKKKYASKGFSFTAYLNNHITNKYGVSVPEVEFVSVSLLLEVKNKFFAITSDVANDSELLLFPETDMEFFISEWTHIDFKAVEKARSKYNPRKMILTHYEESKRIKTKKNDKIVFAQDGDKFLVR